MLFFQLFRKLVKCWKYEIMKRWLRWHTLFFINGLPMHKTNYMQSIELFQYETYLGAYVHKNSKWVWSGNTTITNRRQPCGTARKSGSTIRRHQDHKLSKATSSLFPIKMIAKLELTQSNVQQNIEQLQTLTKGVTINKKSTTTEPPP